MCLWRPGLIECYIGECNRVVESTASKMYRISNRFLDVYR